MPEAIQIDLEPGDLNPLVLALKEALKEALNDVLKGAKEPKKVKEKGFDFAGAVDKVGTALGVGASGLNQMTGRLGVLGAGISVAGSLTTALGGALTAVHPVLGAVVSAIGGLAGPLQDVLGGIVNVASKANPAVVERMQFAIEDAAAVMGRVFVPIVEQMTMGIKLISDVMGALLPSTNDMREVFKQLEPLWSELRDLFSELAPILKVFVFIYLKAFLDILRLMIPVLTAIIFLAKQLPKALTGKAGITIKLPDTAGAAPRPSTILTAEALGQQFRLAAVGSGAADVPTQQLNTQKDILAELRRQQGEKPLDAQRRNR